MPGFEEKTIGHYHIERYLTRGGMSEIYLAQDTDTQRMVALKVVQNTNKDYYERFRHETNTIAELTHDHILPAFDYGEYGAWCYLVTPYIAYGTLQQRLSQGPLTLKRAGMILEQLASALQYAHEQGIVHCDIKPSNVLLRDGEHVYLADFGLVRRLADTNEELSPYLIGTPEYMAPELAETHATASSDIYSLGVLLYQMLTGRVPFTGSTAIGTYLKHLRERPVPPSELNPAIPDAVEAVIMRAIQKNPRRRFPSARAFADAYREALQFEQRALLAAATTVQIRPLAGRPLDVRKGCLLPVGIAKHLQTTAAVVALSIGLIAFPLMLGYALGARHVSGHETPRRISTTNNALDLLPDSSSHISNSLAGGVGDTLSKQTAKAISKQDDDNGQNDKHKHKKKKKHK